MRSSEILSVIEKVYSRIWYVEKEGKLKKCKRSGGKFWEEFESGVRR